MTAFAFPASPQPPIDEAITLRATQWMVALMAAAPDADSHAACAQWRAAHPDHERAWQHLQRFREAMETVPRRAAQAALAPAATVARPGRRKAIALIATTVVAAGAWQLQRGRIFPALVADHATGVGERRQLRLPDGTEIDLDTGSAIAVHFDQTARRVTLLAGAISIRTAKNPAARPFSVTTAQGTMRPLGTRFTVRLHEDATAIAVQEGAVEIRPADAPAAARVLRAGERSRFTRSAIDAVEAGDMADTAWTQGMLAVHDMRLDDFLAELSRYRRGRLACAADAATLRVSGIFPLTDTDKVLAALPHLLPVDVHGYTRYWITVRRRGSA